MSKHADGPEQRLAETFRDDEARAAAADFAELMADDARLDERIAELATTAASVTGLRVFEIDARQAAAVGHFLDRIVHNDRYCRHGNYSGCCGMCDAGFA